MTDISEMDITDPRYPRYIWSDKNIKQARALLKLRYDDAEPTEETIQELIDALIKEFRNDPEQIERAILQHFGVKKKK